MANNSAASIRSALGTNLGEVTQLADVDSGRSMDFDGFPACRYYLIGVTNELRDNAPSYWRTYQFGVQVFAELSNKSTADAEADFQDAIDAIVDKLGTEWTLNGNVDTTVSVSGTIQETESPHGPVASLLLIFEAKTLIS